MVLCPVVFIVLFVWLPMYSEFFLEFSLSDPMEYHVHLFRLFWFYFAVAYYIFHCVVYL